MKRLVQMTRMATSKSRVALIDQFREGGSLKKSEIMKGAMLPARSDPESVTYKC